MSKQIKFTVGDCSQGYKTIEVVIKGGSVSYKVLRNGLLNVDKKISPAVEVSEAWLAELDALKIFDWDKNYSSEILDGVQWELVFKDGRKIYRAHGSNAYPDNFERFLDWLDALAPELEFVNRRRLERVTLNYSQETLTLDRRQKSLMLNKKFSRHAYDLDDIKKIFDAAQNFFYGLEVVDDDLNCNTPASFELFYHDGTIKNFTTPYNENFLPGLNDFIDELHALADDLTAEIFSPTPAQVVPPPGKYIFCKVQFKGSYKHYTYQTDDETLAVGDVVDVPVGKLNDVNQARIVDIGYFDEYEAPFPIERIKKIIGKHLADDWDNF